MAENDIFSIFGQVQSSTFVVVGLFFKFSIVFGRVQRVSVRHCHFRSCSNSYGLLVLVIFKPIFGHIDSVKLTSLVLSFHSST